MPLFRKESTLTKTTARTNATGRAIAQRIEGVRAKTGWDEKILRAPADIAVMTVSLVAVANLGLVMIAAILIAAIVGAIVFT